MTHAIDGHATASSSACCWSSRNLAYLSRMQSTIAYSRKLVALGRLTAGIAHEVKNPLNAMMIHLELLRTKIRAAMRRAQPEPVAAPGTWASAERAATARPASSRARSSTSK